MGPVGGRGLGGSVKFADGKTSSANVPHLNVWDFDISAVEFPQQKKRADPRRILHQDEMMQMHHQKGEGGGAREMRRKRIRRSLFLMDCLEEDFLEDLLGDFFPLPRPRPRATTSASQQENTTISLNHGINIKGHGKFMVFIQKCA